VASQKGTLKGGVTMYKDEDGDLFQLFDIGEMNHIYDLVFNCHDPVPKGHRTILAEALSEFLLPPVEKFISRLYESGRGTNASEFDAAAGFQECIEIVIRLILLRSSEGEMPSAVSHEIAQSLRSTWIEFIAMGAAYRICFDLPKELKIAKKRSIRNRVAAAMQRKSVTKTELERYREEFNYQNGTYRGWKIAAEQHFGITAKTINKRMKE
jgi:hypothetical protein